MRTNLFLVAIFAAFCAIARSEDAKDENETAESKLKVEVLVPPPEDCSRKSTVGEILRMHYTGKLASDGTQFDSSYDRDKPFFFSLGTGEVIKGWDQGLLDMCVGEKRRLTVPPELGYGENGAGDKIPGGATLIFEVELLEIRNGMNPSNVFKDIDKDGDELLSQDEVSDYIRSQESQAGIDALSDTQHNEMVADIFKHEDGDKDGFISHEEFSGPKHDEL